MTDSVPDIEAFVAIGANVAPEENLPRGLDLLARQTAVTGISTIYRTAPLERSGQPEYLNGVVRIRTAMAARTLKFDVLRGIEAALGRIRGTDKFAPREIDLDLVLFGNAVIEEPDLRVPDPHVRERSFVAAALLELAPDLVLPDTGEALADVARAHNICDLVVCDTITKRLKARWGV